MWSYEVNRKINLGPTRFHDNIIYLSAFPQRRHTTEVGLNEEPERPNREWGRIRSHVRLLLHPLLCVLPGWNEDPVANRFDGQDLETSLAEEGIEPRNRPPIVSGRHLDDQWSNQGQEPVEEPLWWVRTPFQTVVVG